MVLKVETRQVLAGAYRGKDIGERTLLTHYLVVDAEKSLCNRVSDGSLSDLSETTEATCEECKARFTRRSAKGLVTR